jgi:AAA family ATPase
MRPGRLDRILFVGAPDLETRKDIFRIRFSTMAVEPGVDVDELAYLVSRLIILAESRVPSLAPTTLLHVSSRANGDFWRDNSDAGLQAEGCSGAEVALICQDAALTAMNEDLDAPFVSPLQDQFSVGHHEAY